MDVCLDFGVPIVHDKTVGLCTCLQYLGIVIDSIRCEFRFPFDKVLCILFFLSVMLRSSKVTVKFLQSLLGLLAFASRILPMGRIFFRRSAMVIADLRNPKLHVDVSRQMKDDLLLW